MGKKVRVKPSKSQSMVGLVVGVVFCLIGLTVVIPAVGLFGIFWTLIAVAITITNGINAFSDKGVATHEFYINDIKDEVSTYNNSNTDFDRINSNMSDTEKRLNEIKHLYDSGLISTEEYKDKRKKIIDNI